MAILLKKMTIFVNFVEKNVKSLAIFWKSNGNFPEGQESKFVDKNDKLEPMLLWSHKVQLRLIEFSELFE